MNKTIFNLNYKISIIIISILGILFAFLSNAFYVSGFLGFILYLFRLVLFIGVFLILHLSEKNNLEFKRTNKRMIGYLTINSLLNIVFAVFASAHLLRGVFLTFSGVICLWLIIAFVIEIARLYTNHKIVDKLLLINEKIGLVFANPIVNVFNIILSIRCLIFKIFKFLQITLITIITSNENINKNSSIPFSPTPIKNIKIL